MIFMIVSKKARPSLIHVLKPEEGNDGFVRSLEANKIRATCNVYEPGCFQRGAIKLEKLRVVRGFYGSREQQP